MTYSDEDILDLYEDLQGVGMTETDGEAVVRHLKAFVDQDYLKDLPHHMTPTRDQAFGLLSRFLTENQIPHSFCSATVIDRGLREVDTYYVFPLIHLKGRVIDSLHYLRNRQDITEERIPDSETILSLSKSLEFYTEIREVPPYSETKVARLSPNFWEVKPWEKEDWEIEPIQDK
jgi:hypothetical protein